MSLARIKRLEVDFAEAEEERRFTLPPTEAGRHAMLLEPDHLKDLRKLFAEAFGADDERATEAHVRSLSYRQLLDTYGQAMDTVVDRDLKSGACDHLRTMSAAEMIGLIQLHNKDPRAAKDEEERIKLEFQQGKRKRAW
jgi:hypothetical protein